MESVVSIKKVLPLALLLTAGNVLAEVGDIHTVKVDNAVVREDANKGSAQVEKLGKGAEIMEMDIKGEWYEIYVASSDLSGWMHVSTLALLGQDSGGSAAPAAASSKPAAKKKVAKAPKLKIKSGGKKTSGMKEFEKYLLKYNARTYVLKGYTPFTNAQEIDDGNLQVTVTNTWMEKSKARQKSSLITLYTRWKKASKNSDSKIIAVDTSGNEVLNYPK